MGFSRVIVGLGNPGPEYVFTRHNLGFWAVDLLSDVYRIRVNKTAAHSLVGYGSIRGHNIALVKPKTYMNDSGRAVGAILKSEGLGSEHLLVMHDDMDIALGRVKLKTSGGDAGNNGIASIIETLGTREFDRLRIGLGPRPRHIGGADWVLSVFPEEQLEIAREGAQLAAERALEWLVLNKK
jgi:PTH1 family peptidyl-tRNA hydrolase